MLKKFLWRAKRHGINAVCGTIAALGLLFFATGVYHLVTKPLTEATAVAIVATVAGILVGVASYGSKAWLFEHTLTSDELDGNYDN